MTIQISLSEFRRGYQAFQTHEARDAMYKIATFVVSQFWGRPADMADGLGVLLLTWNQAFYRYGSFDFDRLEQVFSNILDNAIKNSLYEGEVKIIGRNIDDCLVEVRVVDNGPGIPPEQLPHLFERFHQTSSVRSGFGLGLAIAREIVLVHGGTIEAKSEPGEGAEFVIRLPLKHSKV